MLGQMNYMGVGTDVNLPRALEYFNQAANQGDATAKAYLAQMHAQGDGVPQDNSTAFKLYQEAADGVCQCCRTPAVIGWQAFITRLVSQINGGPTWKAPCAP
jgi:hypothetical protein